MTTIKGQYQITDWQEASYYDVPAPAKATRAEIKLSFGGDLPDDEQRGMKGAADLVYLMSYVRDDLVYYSGFLYFTGTLGGQKGGFTLVDHGVFNDSGATSHWVIADGSGTGALAGISGEGRYTSASERLVDFELTYQLTENSAS